MPHGPSFRLNNPPSPEREAPTYETLLHIFRHARKAGGNDVSQEVDIAMPITPEGRTDSKEAGEKLDRILDAWALAVGSPRRRSQETAVYTKGTENNDPWTSALQEGVWKDKRLDMPFEKGESPEFREILKAAERGEYFKRCYEMYEEAEDGAKNDTTYAHQVYNIASLIARHAGINLELAKRKDYYDGAESVDTPRAIERFMGTHGGITESFVLAFIKKTKSEEEFQRFRSLFPQGFAYNEGMDVRILSPADSKDPLVRISVDVSVGDNDRYVLDETVTASVIEELVREYESTTHK